jgi:hypothetical protein
MNFNVYIDKETVRRLERLAKARRTSRNALIREAVEQLLDRAPDAGWPRAVLDFEGFAGAVVFETSRKKLRPPRRDPLA